LRSCGGKETEKLGQRRSIFRPEKRTWTHVNDLRVVVAAEKSVDDVSFASVKESAISIRLRTRCRIPSGTLGNKSEKDRQRLGATHSNEGRLTVVAMLAVDVVGEGCKSAHARVRTASAEASSCGAKCHDLPLPLPSMRKTAFLPALLSQSTPEKWLKFQISSEY
jgi:hypothetical protein